MQFKNKKINFFKKIKFQPHYYVCNKEQHQILKIQPSNGPALDLY